MLPSRPASATVTLLFANDRGERTMRQAALRRLFARYGMAASSTVSPGATAAIVGRP